MIQWPFFPFVLILLSTFSCFAIQDPLPSWNEGPAKSALVEFIQATTTESSKDYIPPADRIATIDQDGTLWVEQPLYTQFIFTFDEIKKLAPEHPEWKNEMPFQAILEDDFLAFKNFTENDFGKIFDITHSGMTIDQYRQNVLTWLSWAKHPRFQKSYTDLVYQPMLEVIRILKDNGYKVYIVSGGGQDFIRAYSEKVYGIPPENVIGSTGKVKYEYQNGKPILMMLPEELFISDKGGKPEAIHLIIGKQPHASFGNSVGDQQMLEWSQAVPRRTLQFLIHHDDPIREYAYDTQSSVGTFSHALMEEAEKNKWIVVSMKNDWKVIFPEWPDHNSSRK